MIAIPRLASSQAQKSTWSGFMSLALLLGGCGSTAPVALNESSREVVLQSSTPTPSVEAHCDPDGTQSSGAIYRICIPEDWNGSLVVFARGYVSPFEPVAIPEDQLTIPDGPSIPGIINGLGFAFATSSFAANGLAVRESIPDLVELVEIFRASYGQPEQIYLVGVSLGSLISVLTIEENPSLFTGVLPACGPIGSFQAQVDYLGDFRVVFDYFFPDVLPGTPIQIPPELVQDWEPVYLPRIRTALQQNPQATDQLLKVTRAAIDQQDPGSREATVIELLWFNVFATEDIISHLQGQPYDNQTRIYRGSRNDLLLNLHVERYAGDSAARQRLSELWETRGVLNVPTQMVHTIDDPLIPYWHVPWFRSKVLRSGTVSLLRNLPARGYGHCEFTVAQALASLVFLLQRTEGPPLINPERLLPDLEAKAEYRRLLERNIPLEK
jgi:pimeloyl-ACP methyl ester carboxylesterase